MPNVKRNRVMAYVDGFNLYYGLRDSGLGHLKWLNVHALAGHLLFPGQVLVGTKYFTARISGARPGDKAAYAAERNAKHKRQATFLDALRTVRDIRIFYGRYLDKPRQCMKCGATWVTAEEKMTDVSIATELLVDTFADSYDTAIVISADSDLVPPIEAIRKHFPHKRINVAFPPGRNSTALQKAGHGMCVIHKGNLKKSQLPESVTTSNGFALTRPVEWMK